MKFYLSSYRLGDEPELFAQLVGDGGAVGYVPNALDHVTDREEWLEAHIRGDIGSLQSIGLKPQILDLKSYFSDKDRLVTVMQQLDGVWVSGGNVFILRQAMKLSSFDTILYEFSNATDFVYGGYSAGCCVLSESLEPYQKGSNPEARAYQTQDDVIWDGVGLLDFAFMPHYNSEHLESALISEEIQYCIDNQIRYQAFSDGDVLVIE